MDLTFLGGAETLTGSRLLADAADARVLVDCELFQGVKRLRELNWESFPIEPGSIDAVVSTHAHIDHSGYLPALIRDGFGGECAPGTAALAGILLRDTARLQEEDARFANKRRSSKHHAALPLFTVADAERALERLRVHDGLNAFEVAPGVHVRFSPAGHILGAASVWLSDGQRSVLFSGDLGRSDDWVVHPPAAPLAADHVVIEPTYGNRHLPRPDSSSARRLGGGSTGPSRLTSSSSCALR